MDNSQVLNSDLAQVSPAPSEFDEPNNRDWTEERRQNARRVYPVNLTVAPFDASKPPADIAFLRVRCQDISVDGISFFLPEPPTFQYMVLVHGKPPHQTYVMAQVIHYRPDSNPTGEYLVGCRLLGKVTVAVVEGSACLSTPCSVPGVEAEQKAAEAQPEQPSAPPETAKGPPRAAARETRAGIETMRELALASARGNIHRNFRWQMLLAAGNNLLVATIGLLAGAALLWSLKLPNANGIVVYTASASLLVAILWGTRFAVAVQRLMVDNRRRQ